MKTNQNPAAIKVLSVNISDQKGTIKKPVSEIYCNANGIEKDAHAGSWHRQVSLLGIESVEKFSKEAGRQIAYGEFAENITTSGIVLFKTAPLDRLTIGEVELEITQIGKKCHGTSCAIFKEVGNCVMPKEGIFARVLKNGHIQADDTISYHPKVFKAMVITLSDRASKGEYADLSGPEIISQLETFFYINNWQHSISYKLIPDDPQTLRALLSESDGYDMVFTTGGTGVGPRDFTPEIAREILTKEIPGIMENIRLKFGSQKPNALLSRGVAGIVDETFLYVLPGSVRAVNEYMGEILQTLRHLIFMLKGIDVH
jgi:molybdopterin adenylyltransferase